MSRAPPVIALAKVCALETRNFVSEEARKKRSLLTLPSSTTHQTSLFPRNESYHYDGYEVKKSSKLKTWGGGGGASGSSVCALYPKFNFSTEKPNSETLTDLRYHR